jgi:PAS domain-containing protein
MVFGLREDGTEFPAETSISKFEVREEKVLTVRLRGITEPRRAEEKLLQFAAIVESSDDAITWNGPGRHHSHLEPGRRAALRPLG